MQPVQDAIQNIFSNLGNTGSWLKLLFLLVMTPIWFPIVRVMWREVNEVLAPEGGLYANKPTREIRRRAPGEDPFINIPLASHRTQRRRNAHSPEPTHNVIPTPSARGMRAGSANPKTRRPTRL